MIELILKGQKVQLNKASDLTTYIELADQLGHDIAQLHISVTDNPDLVLNNTVYWYDVNIESIKAVVHLLKLLPSDRLSDALLEMLPSDRNTQEQKLVLRAGEALELLYPRDMMIDYDLSLHSFAAEITGNTLIYLRNANMELITIPIGALLQIKLLGL